MLSAILDSLKNMTFSTADIPLLTLAYPDLKPWQVKKVFLNDNTSESKDESSSSSKSDKMGNKLDLSFYYVYLSTLLHQSNGHHQARHDIHIVNVSLILSSQHVVLLSEFYVPLTYFLFYYRNGVNGQP